MTAAKQAGFNNFNLDIMFGLPAQTIPMPCMTLKPHCNVNPRIFSWYQLTIEPNTLFYHQRPTLPPDESIWEMQLAGQALLAERGYQQYEVSAYAKAGRECLHNRNYWEFGDYLGIGAGAHSKITDIHQHQVRRFQQMRHPKDYLDAGKRRNISIKEVGEKNLCLSLC